MTYCIVDNFAGNVDGEAAEDFFHAQAVDGISAGGGRRSLCIVPTRVTSLRTAQSACLHRVSTRLCTPQLDGTRAAARECRPYASECLVCHSELSR